MIREIVNLLQDELHKANIKNEIFMRLKDPHSVLKKMKRKNAHVAELGDLIAFRIIVNCKDDCLKVLHIIDNFCHFNLKRTKDYISNPKENGYQSIHTIIKLLYSRRHAEIQVRSNEMHKVAELGRAAHLDYKKAQDQNLMKLLNLEKNSIFHKAHEMFNKFTWTEEEILAYEEEIMQIWHNQIDKLFGTEDSVKELIYNED